MPLFSVLLMNRLIVQRPQILAAEQGLTDDLQDAMNEASRQSLRTTAISFPLVMLIAFGFIASIIARWAVTIRSSCSVHHLTANNC